MKNNIPHNHYQNSNTPVLFEQCNEVIYTDPITDQKCLAWISDIHDQDIDNLFYTVKFATKKELKIATEHLSPLASEFVQAHQVKPSKWFPNVDVSLLIANSAPTQTAQPPVATPHTIIPDEKYHVPNNFDVKAFQQQFQPKLHCDSDILTFYKQLRSQGAKYNIYLIDINKVTTFVDLCPKEVSPATHKKMSIAIFQKLREENSKDITYNTLENSIQQHSSSSDGYETVEELLRRVRPELKRYKIQYDIPKLSAYENDIFKW